MHGDYLFLKSAELSYYIRTCKDMFNYIEKHIRVPNNIRFNMSKRAYKDFEKRVLSKDATVEDFKKLVSVYTSLQTERLFVIYRMYFDDLPF